MYGISPWRYLFARSWCDARDFEPIRFANLISVGFRGARQAICWGIHSE